MLSGREGRAVQYYILLGKTRPLHCQRAPGGQGGRELSFCTIIAGGLVRHLMTMRRTNVEMQKKKSPFRPVSLTMYLGYFLPGLHAFSYLVT